MDRRWQLHGNTAQVVSAGAAIVTLFVAVGGFSIAYRQITIIRENTREAAARTMYGEYLKFGMDKEKAKFICPLDGGGRIVDEGAPKKDANGQTLPPSDEFLIYRAYVRYMLNAYELILDTVGEGDQGWIKSITADLECHTAIFELPDFLCFAFTTYDEKLQRLILKVIGGRSRLYEVCRT
jgi:hypothetical protein